jgi:hypothetical protein
MVYLASDGLPNLPMVYLASDGLSTSDGLPSPLWLIYP